MNPVYPPARRLLFEFKQRVGQQVLQLRLYRAAPGLVCERELQERDGSAAVQVLPLRQWQQMQEFLQADPLHARIKAGAGKAFDTLAAEIDHEHGAHA